MIATLLGILPSLASVIMVLLRGIIDIVIDLSGSRIGRYVLAAIALIALGGYIYHSGASSGRRSCQQAVHRPAAPDNPFKALDLREIFEGNN